MIKKNIFIVALVSMALSSCYEDKSTLPVKIDDVVLNTSIADKTIRTGYLQQLDMVPDLTKGGKAIGDEGFTYTWEINVLPNDSEFEVIGTERELHTIINNPIANGSYILKLTVHDDAEDLSYLFNWDVYVETAFLDGLVVSDTRDGKTSDLTLILNNKLTMDYYKDEIIYRNIVTTATGQPYQSLLTSLTPFLYGYIDLNAHTNYLFAVDSDQHLVRFDCLDFSWINGKDVVYYYDGETVKNLFSVGASVSSCTHFLITNKGVYYSDNNGTNFVTALNTTLSSSAPKDNVIAFRTYADSWDGSCAAAWIDENDGNIILLDVVYGGGNYQTLQENENSAFTAGDLGVQHVLAAEMTNGGKTPTLLVQEADGNYALYTVASVTNTYYDEEWDYSWEETTYIPGQHIVVPANVATRISSSVNTVLTDENSILYVATPTEVSAALFGTGTMTDAGTKFTPDAGESITSVKVYHQGDYFYSSGLLLPENYDENGKAKLELTSRALIVTTQKGDEGFVYVVPMTQIGTGNLDRASAMKYDGFGKILDVATTGY